MNFIDRKNLFADDGKNNLYFIYFFENNFNPNDQERSEKNVLSVNETTTQNFTNLKISKKKSVNIFDDKKIFIYFNIRSIMTYNQILLENSIIVKLIKSACNARKKSYSYSNFCVGVAILDFNNNIFEGTNWENVSYPAGCCGEICAISNAIAHKSNKFKAIVIVGDKNNIKEPPFKDYAYPCGIYRQALSEFGGENLIVIIAKSKTYYIVKKFIEIINIKNLKY